MARRAVQKSDQKNDIFVVRAVAVTCLAMNLLLWNKIDAVSINVDSRIESSTKNINDNVNERFEKIARQLGQMLCVF